MRQYYGPVIFIISACGAGEQKLTSELIKVEKSDGLLDIPAYLFVTADKVVAWQDAAVAWTVFYHQLSEVDLEDKAAMQNAISKVLIACGVRLRYYRWDSEYEIYRKYEPSGNY